MLMGKKLIITSMLLSFFLAGPAMAVKKVSKSTGQQTAEQSPAQDKAAPAPAPDKMTPPAAHRPDVSNDNNKTQPSDRVAPNGDKDRFIDRDGDGINDNLKKPPETIKRRRDNVQPPAIERQRQPKEIQKPPVIERDRQPKERVRPSNPPEREKPSENPQKATSNQRSR